MKTKKRTHGILYQGPSLLDGKMIVVIATITKSNSKTGKMLQTYILREDINPMEASKTGQDFSICGNCPMRGEVTTDPKRKIAKGRKCYVNIAQGVLIVYKAFMRGVYAPLNADEAAELGRGAMVRLGTYGDPSAIPGHYWETLLTNSSGRTGYSHQANVVGADFRPDLVMMSADNLAQAETAWNAGNRTFRVVQNVSEIVKGKEILCPASKEAGFKTTCNACLLCSGNGLKAKSIAIPDHGIQARASAKRNSLFTQNGIAI
jgi:hypothetical protein